MEFDAKLVHDLLDFLRTLEDVPLPPIFATLRATLLGRMQAAISAGDNYIDMKPGKKLNDVNTVANDSAEEYVTTDQQPNSPGSFLYPNPTKKAASTKTTRTVFESSRQSDNNSSARQSQDVAPPPRPSPQQSTQPSVTPVNEVDVKTVEAEEIVDPFIEIYSNMNLIQAEAKSHIFGQLQKRERRFFFESNRLFWAVLIGHHFLSYDNRADLKPSQILSIKGCTCKAVLSPQRNTRRCETMFELCFEDDKCFQFIASTPKEMEQWIAAIRRWEAKSRDMNNVTQTQIEMARAATVIAEVEQTSRISSSSEVYEDIAVPDNKLVNSAKNLRQNSSTSPKPTATTNEIKAKKEAPKTGNNILPLAPKLIKRDLPPPPPSPQSDDEDMLYHIIDEPGNTKLGRNCNTGSEIKQRNSSLSKKDFVESTEELYDDILTVKKEVQKIVKDKQINVETEKNTGVKASVEDNEETYDDVDVVKKEVETIRRSEYLMKESTEVEKESNSSKESPKIPARNSPMKCFFGRFRNKSESSQKEEVRKKLPIPSPQNTAKSGTSTEVQNERSSSATKNDNCANDQAEDELSNYNSPPPPRPIRNNIEDDEEDMLYDDVAANKKAGSNASPQSELDKRKIADNFVPKINAFPVNKDKSLAGINSQKNVARNLNDQFDGEIYQNQSTEESVADDSEHYQVPRSDANSSKPSYIEDDDSEKIYDDVEIVAKKKRENEKAKQKPAALSPSKYNRSPPVGAKPVDNFFQQKLNKFSLLVGEKSASEKKFQHRFGVGKKTKVQEVIITGEKHPIKADDDNELYDDCQAMQG